MIKARALLNLAALIATLQFAAACAPVSQQAANTESVQQSSTSTSDVTKGNCQARFDAFAEKQLDWYRARTSYLPIAKIRSVYAQGTNGHAVVVVHGYNSSPHNQRDITLALVAKGFTVIAPLLTGYGVDAATSNKATFADWQKAVEDAAEVVRPCHSKVSLLGHSFGGSLVTYEALSGRIPNLAKVVSLAPFYKSSTPLLDQTVYSAAAQFPTMSTTVLQTYLDTAAYEFVIGGETGEADPSLPMLALTKVFDSQALFASTSGSKSSTPIFLAVSNDDMVIDNAYAQTYVKAKFTSQTTLAYPKALEIGHSFQRRPNNPMFDDLMTRIVAHLSAN